MLENGTKAPDFELDSKIDQKIALSNLRGKKVILVFYPADWSTVCSDQIALYNEMSGLFEKHNAQMLGISVDGKWCHKAFAEHRNIGFPLLADFEPKGAVSMLYESYTEFGFSARNLYVIDEDGIIRWSYVSPIGENPGGDGILKALEDIDNG
ncbi:MAG: redoxin domain-containing protein [Pyrinomonadaceae bacterium]